MKELANIVGLQNLRAPKFQNEVVDVVWESGEKDMKISIKTATVNKGKKILVICILC